MASNSELVVLKNLLKAIKEDKPSIFSKVWFTLIFWLTSAILFIAAFKYYEQNDSVWAIVLCSLIIGIAIGFVSRSKGDHKIWCIIKNHINTGSIDDRINEINT